MKVTPLESWIIERTHLVNNTQESLKEYQLGKLIKTLNYAKEKSKFYKTTLKDIDVSSITSLDDFSAIAFTTPEDIKSSAHDFLCVASHEVERIVTLNTSGTTGDEKRIFFTHEDLEATIDFFDYGMRCLVEKSDKVLVLLPGPSYGSIGDLLKKALALSKIDCIVHGVISDVEKTAQSIVENNITCLVGIPMQVLYLSKVKPEVFKKHIKKVLLSTDYVPDVLVEALSHNGKCKVFNHYGMTEMGYGGGVECECLNGYHLRENDLYFEIIDPITKNPVKDGTYGEVVFTTLNRQAMPLIRYKTGDKARFISKPCGCGTFLRTMEKVLGRIENKVCINGHDIHMQNLDEIILIHDEVLNYKVEFYQENTLHVKLILQENSDYENVIQNLYKSLSNHFNFEVKIVWQWDNYVSDVTNSMIKRKIHYSKKGR